MTTGLSVVNLYAPSSVTWDQGGRDITLTMATAFPYHPEVSITVTLSETNPFAIRIRIPSWAAGSMTVTVNGSDFVTGQPGSYVSLNRTWSNQQTMPQHRMRRTFRRYPQVYPALTGGFGTSSWSP